jgi:hypothetical protein
MLVNINIYSLYLRIQKVLLKKEKNNKRTRIPVFCDQVMDKDGHLKLCKVGSYAKSHTPTKSHESFRPCMQFLSLFSKETKSIQINGN